jgi:hypothetical protein
MDIKYILKIFIVVFLILSLIAFINSIGLNLNESDIPKKLLQVVTIEGLNTQLPASSSSAAFCDSNKGYALEKSCNKLTKYNCGLTSCCIWTNNNKCKAGNESGPTFNSNGKGKTLPLDYYYYQNKCYGAGCTHAKK